MAERNPVLIRTERLHVSARIRSRDEHLGRFGGGWQWAVGFESGGVHHAPTGRRCTIILNLLTFSVRITLGRRPWRG